MENQDLFSRASAVVLTGGKSSRMGQPKALLPFGQQPLIAHIVGALQSLFADIVVVTAPGQELPELPARLTCDEIPFQGPVGGIYYGLKAIRGEFCFVTSCDAAFLNPKLIAHLLSRIADYDVVVPVWEDRLQPLHAIYRRSVLPLLEIQLQRGELRPIFLFDKVRTWKIAEGEIRRYDPEGLSFFNMNTPADYQAALNRWKNHAPRSPAKSQDRPANIELQSGSATLTGSAAAPVFTPGSNSVTVELFGVARLVAKTRSISLAVPPEANLGAVLKVLATELPVLVGRVIDADCSTLVAGYACNVNGRSFVRGPSAKVNPGDKIFILSADAGG
jgi:molybdenum cofactor guanylyltransferase